MSNLMMFRLCMRASLPAKSPSDEFLPARSRHRAGPGAAIRSSAVGARTGPPTGYGLPAPILTSLALASSTPLLTTARPGCLRLSYRDFTRSFDRILADRFRALDGRDPLGIPAVQRGISTLDTGAGRRAIGGISTPIGPGDETTSTTSMPTLRCLCGSHDARGPRFGGRSQQQERAHGHRSLEFDKRHTSAPRLVLAELVQRHTVAQNRGAHPDFDRLYCVILHGV